MLRSRAPNTSKSEKPWTDEGRPIRSLIIEMT
jgi:hypothetical protein